MCGVERAGRPATGPCVPSCCVSCNLFRAFCMICLEEDRPVEAWKLYIPVGCRKGEDGEVELLPLLDSLGHTKTTNFFSRTFKINKILLPCSSRVYRGVLGQIIVDEASDNRDESNEMVGAPSSSDCLHPPLRPRSCTQTPGRTQMYVCEGLHRCITVARC
ncbi:hypothetical protein Naga_100086g3 [Nannochloropsis gaditana]|uniref:Uncharacterized protein n=1 Tax=Nannochloropsis gaditana TaxID=72520 RepID=W7TWF1_9STRA|nr:hypothetical protein Naga_100086g3 [Nannochloropsis gaditana]